MELPGGHTLDCSTHSLTHPPSVQLVSRYSGRQCCHLCDHLVCRRTLFTLLHCSNANCSHLSHVLNIITLEMGCDFLHIVLYL